MGKVLNPIVVNPKKDQIAKPYNRKDIEKLAYDVLADLGDEVINKAIEDGKIVLPQNIDVANLPVLPTSTSTEYFNFAGKAFKNPDGTVWIPIIEFDAGNKDYLYFTFESKDDDFILQFRNYYESGGSVVFDSFSYNLANIPSEPISPGTKLYRHKIRFTMEDSSHGDDVDDTAYPLHIITASPIPLTLDSLADLPLHTGENMISGSNDMGYYISYMYYDSHANTIRCNIDSINGYIDYETISDFSDTVTEL